MNPEYEAKVLEFANDAERVSAMIAAQAVVRSRIDQDIALLMAHDMVNDFRDTLLKAVQTHITAIFASPAIEEARQILARKA